MIHDIQDFNERMRDERIARNNKRLRNAMWIVIGVMLLANVLKALGV